MNRIFSYDFLKLEFRDIYEDIEELRKKTTDDDIEKSILEKYFENRNQITIDFLLGTDKSEGEMIKEAYRLANKEIGYRIEHLDLKKSKL